MIKNYFKTTLRHLWRNRLFTALNVLGLAIGISACWLIYQIVDYEFSYDRTTPNKENIYRLVSGFTFDEKENYNGGVSAPLAHNLKDYVPNVIRSAPVFTQRINTVSIPRNGEKPVLVENPEYVVATDSSYFALVPYTWLAGNPQNALARPENVVLTEERAKRYFRDLSVNQMMGKTVVYNDTIHRTVSGIVQNRKGQTEFYDQEFLALQPKVYGLDAWGSTNGNDKVYIQLGKNTNPQQILDQINAIAAQKRKQNEGEEQWGSKMNSWLELVPLVDMHFATHVNEYTAASRRASKPVLYGLMAVGVFLLLLACINYINMSTAQIPQRSKEIGVRKTLGSSRGQLINQFFGETLLTTCLATLLAYGLSRLAFLWLSDLIPQGVEGNVDPLALLIFLVALILLVTILSAFYPAWLITKVRTTSVLKGQHSVSMGKNRISLRKMLIVFQFVIAQTFITSALIMGSQLKYTLQKDLGFDKEAVMVFSIPWKLQRDTAYNQVKFTLLDELKKESGIQSAALGTVPMTENYSSSSYEYVDEKQNKTSRQVFHKWIDSTYMELYGLELLAGRKHGASDKEYVLNETAVKAFGFQSPQDAIGKFIGTQDDKYQIVGVVKDFHSRNFYTAIEPVALVADGSNLSTFNIKLNTYDPAKWQQTIQIIEQKWHRFYPAETFAGKFYDERLEAIYKEERNLAKVINLATTIAILVSCLGLFGLAALTAFQRTKEIGIRKVLGASVSGIVGLLSKDFVKLVLLAIIIASPIAWWAMNKWLEDFAYKIEIQWWMFVLAGTVAVAIALLTVATQAIKAAVVNPVDSLRDE